MRLEAVLAPHAGHHHVTHVEMRCEFARTPVGPPADGRVPSRLQNPRFQLRGEHRGDLAHMPAVETRDALLCESPRPTRHKPTAALDLLGGFIPRMPVRE